MTKETANPTFYDADSATYDEQRWTTPAGAHTNRAQQGIVQDLCADWNEQRVVEIGPGTARFTIPMCRKGNRMTLVDVSPGMLATARGRVEAAGLTDSIDDYIQGSIYELPFDDGAFDHAISVNVFNHLEKAGDALAEMARVIKPGSTLLFNHANLHSYYWGAGRRINRRATATGQDVFSIWERPSDVRRMIEAAGLEVVARAGHVHMPRSMERFRLGPFVRLLDAVSRRGTLRPFAPSQFCLCRRG